MKNKCVACGNDSFEIVDNNVRCPNCHTVWKKEPNRIHSWFDREYGILGKDFYKRLYIGEDESNV